MAIKGEDIFFLPARNDGEDGWSKGRWDSADLLSSGFAILTILIILVILVILIILIILIILTILIILIMKFLIQCNGLNLNIFTTRASFSSENL